MGEKDKSEKYLEAYDDVFADIFNVLVFGEYIIIPDSLTNAGTETIYKSKEGKLRNQFRDIQKYYNESHIHIASLGIENQSEEDKDMVIRILGYDYASYREQIINKKEGRYPVITIVLNFSEEKWSAPKSLIEVLDIPKELEGYVEEDIIKNNVEGDVSMCKVLDEYERRGIEKGILNLVKNNRLSVEVACEELNISKEELEEKLENYKLSIV